MNFAEKFENNLNQSLELLAQDEWAVFAARQAAVIGLSSPEAFENIDNILALSLKQHDWYARSACICLAYDLVSIAKTTELPHSTEILLEKLKVDLDNECKKDLNVLLKHYRLKQIT